MGGLFANGPVLQPLEKRRGHMRIQSLGKTQGACRVGASLLCCEMPSPRQVEIGAKPFRDFRSFRTPSRAVERRALGSRNSRLLPTFDSLALWAVHGPLSAVPSVARIFREFSSVLRSIRVTCSKDFCLSSDSLSLQHVAGGWAVCLRTDPCCNRFEGNPGQSRPQSSPRAPLAFPARATGRCRSVQGLRLP